MIEEHLQDITLIQGDCKAYMRTLPDKAFDLAIVDPPYGINITKQGLGRGGGDYIGKKKKTINLVYGMIKFPITNILNS